MGTGSLRLYDREIGDLLAYLKELPLVRLPAAEPWPCPEKESLVLRSEMALELGGGTHPAVSGLGFTTDPGLVPEDGVFLAGKDLKELAGSAAPEVPCARITLLRLSPEAAGREELHGLLRGIEYTRYHVHPEGYMMRISAVHEREPARVAAEALKQGMDFGRIGQSFLAAYRKRPGVEAVMTFFVTDPAADYDRLGRFARQCERITQSLDQVFSGLTMDCSVCAQKDLCDEIDGLRELHAGM